MMDSLSVSAVKASSLAADRSQVGWEDTLLGEVGTIYGGSTPSTRDPSYWDGDIAWLTPSDVTKAGQLYIGETARAITRQGLASCAAKVLPPGTLMMTSRATIGEVAIAAKPMATNQGFINVVCNQHRVHNEFLAYWIMQNHPAIEERAHGATFREISKSNFKTIPILLPPLPEQRAIAYVLRSVQDAITARRRELELERERKAALMQHLFTHGTRGEPTKMTEIGEMPESWRVVRLGEMVTLQRGFDLPENKRIPGPYPVMGGNGVSGYHSGFSTKGPGVCVGRSGAGGVGKVNWTEMDYWALNTTLWVAVFHGNNPKFVYYRLLSLNLRQYSEGASVPTLNRNMVHPILMGLAPVREQGDIAGILTASDVKITKLDREVSLFKELFRALLEELMTGRLSALTLVDGEESLGVVSVG